METKVEIIQFISQPGVAESGFSKNIVADVLPMVDMTPTRGGQIASQTLLRHDDGRHQWWIAYETSGGSWVEDRLHAAREKLASLAVVFADDSWDLLDTATIFSRDENKLLPLLDPGQHRNVIREYIITPGKGGNEELERAVKESFFAGPLPPISDRRGHIRSHILLKAPEQKNKPDRYLFGVYRITLMDNFLVEEGGKIDDLAIIRGIEEFRILEHITPQ